MDKNLNLVEILKNCPRGTKLYSTIHGEVEFEQIIIDDKFPIKFSFKVKSRHSNSIYAASVSIDGRYSIYYEGECILFPSKDNRDWSTFNIKPKFNINTLEPYAKVLVRYNKDDNWIALLFSHYQNGYCYCGCAAWKQCIPYNEETKHLRGTAIDCPEFYKWW